MKQLGRFVGKTVRSLRAEQAIKLHQLKSAWLDAVGPFLGSQTEPVRIKNDTLYLIVSSPMWAQEVKLQQRLILKNLNRKMARPPRKISCWVGEVHAKRLSVKTEETVDEDELVPWKNLEVPPDRRGSIEATVASIDDPKLKKRMRQLLELSVQREIYLLQQGQLPCPICGNFRPASSEYCQSCRRERLEHEERNVMRLLARKPWLTAKDVAERLPLRDRNTYMRVRKALLADWMLQAWQLTSGLESAEITESLDSKLRTLLLDVTMLRCSLPAHSLRDKHFYFALGKRLATGYLKDV